MFIKGKVNQIDSNFLIKKKKTHDKIDKKWFQSHTFIFVYKTSDLNAQKEILLTFLPITTTSNKLVLKQTCSYLIKHLMAIFKVAP